MVSSEDRIINAMELGDPIDKIPKMELFSSILPFVKFFINWEAFPPRIRRLNAKWKILEESVNAVKEKLKMKKYNPNEQYTLFGRLIRKLPLENAAKNFFPVDSEKNPKNQKVEDDNAVAIAKLYAQVPIKLKYDTWCLISLGLPDPDMGLRKTKDGNYYLVNGEGAIMDIRATDLEVVQKGIFEENIEKSIEMSKIFFENAQIERYTNIISRTINSKYRMRKIKDQLVPAITLPGPFETWLYTFGNHNMQGFYRRVFKEYRDGCKGTYSELLKVKTKVFCELVKQFAEVDMKVFIIGDDCAHIHGPMLRPDIYRDFIAIHIKKIVDQAHKVGVKVGLHTDGKFKIENTDNDEKKWEFMNIILNTGIDALHPIEMFANDIEEIRQNFCDRICICNGINTIELQTGSRQSVALLTKRILDKVYSGGGNRLNGYIAGSDNSLMAGCQPFLVRQMLHTIDEYAKKILKL